MVKLKSLKKEILPAAIIIAVSIGFWIYFQMYIAGKVNNIGF